jgi:hypothetical protein
VRPGHRFEELLTLLGLPRIRRQDRVELAPVLGEGVVLLIKVRLGLGLEGPVGECPLSGGLLQHQHGAVARKRSVGHGSLQACGVWRVWPLACRLGRGNQRALACSPY